MCGFAGFYGGEWESRKEICERMGEKIAHRGPDEARSYDDGKLSVSFRRLSIIDLDRGSQPMTSEDGRYVLVFNGEIYNFRELREELEEPGRPFATDSDTEVLLRCCQKYGEQTPKHLRGMFAFVFYDREKKSLFGARDFFGIKPLFYAMWEGTLLFGSEIKSFLPHPAFKKEIHKEALKLYLEFQYSPLPETIFKGVYRLLPGHFFTYDEKNGFRTEAYFEPKLEKKKKSFHKAVSGIEKAVLSSVEYHQISDVEVGSFLSGGVDSSFVASTVRPMKTYSVGFAVEKFDETGQAARLSELLKMPNRAKMISPEEFFDALPDVQYYSDEPHANLSAVPLYYLAGLAAEDLKVVLSGEGADELFGGYDWYIQSEAARRMKKLPKAVKHTLAKTLGRLPVRHLASFFKALDENVEDTYIGQAFIMDDKEANRLLAPEWRCDISYKDVTAPFYEKVKGKDDLTKKLYLDMKLWLPGDILLKADRMTMAHSLELRVPYLDTEVWEQARTLPPAFKAKGRKTKRAFRAAAGRHVPKEWKKRKKAGFMVPFRVWLREERFASRVREAFESEAAGIFFDREALLDLLERHVAGKGNHARKIYTVYSFLLWYDRYFVSTKEAGHEDKK